MEDKRICLSDLPLPRLTEYMKELGQPAFRAKQIFSWIHRKLVTDFSAMTDQPKALLQTFAENCTLAAPTIRRRQQSKDGTVKYLLDWLTVTALKPYSCGTTMEIRFAYPPRWAVQWGAGSVLLPRPGGCGT